jgi:hypothetical protein
MSDIVERIRKLRFVHIPGTSDLMEQACQEIERLRNGAVTGRETVRLTDAEREAIEQMLDEVSGRACAESWVPATLRSLLERLA